MSQPRILIVDDEKNVRRVLLRILADEGYAFDTAANGAEALGKIAAQDYEVILLDLNMEPIHGLDVLSQLRAQNNKCVVIILTAYSSLESAIVALREGAFDYLIKPVSAKRLRQRVREGVAQQLKQREQQQVISQIKDLRETLNQIAPSALEKPPPPNRSASGKVVIDSRHRQIYLDNRPLDLTSTEFNLLHCLVRATPEPLSPRELVNCALGYDCSKVKAREIIKWHIHQLRRKIEPDATNPQYIKTVRYKGYLWAGDGETMDSTLGG